MLRLFSRQPAAFDGSQQIILALLTKTYPLNVPSPPEIPKPPFYSLENEPMRIHGHNRNRCGVRATPNPSRGSQKRYQENEVQPLNNHGFVVAEAHDTSATFAPCAHIHAIAILDHVCRDVSCDRKASSSTLQAPIIYSVSGRYQTYIRSS